MVQIWLFLGLISFILSISCAPYANIAWTMKDNIALVLLLKQEVKDIDFIILTSALKE